MSFAKNISNTIGKNINKNISGKYGPGMLATYQNRLDHAKQAATDVLKTATNWVIPKTEEVTGDLIGNKITNKITKAQKKSTRK